MKGYGRCFTCGKLFKKFSDNSKWIEVTVNEELDEKELIDVTDKCCKVYII